MAQNTTPPHGPSTLTVKGRNVRLRTIGVSVLAVLAIWFIAANTGSVSVKLWIPTVTLPLWVVLTVTLLVGVVIGWLLARRRARPPVAR
ncbi:LapA family protein [Kitasatospora sp. NBC_00374]|uniref:LapA family protein n=1 Tax=Kitasatospora sp. NBC_00374 TaxID=2975964 RepID=UPI0032548AFD